MLQCWLLISSMLAAATATATADVVTVSPCCLQVEVLPAITVAGIKIILQETLLSSRSTPTLLIDQLGLRSNQDRLDAFCKRIHQLSGGVPLFVQRALTAAVVTGVSWGIVQQATFDLILHDQYEACGSGKIDTYHTCLLQVAILWVSQSLPA